jgi:hypothetical protein
MATTEFEVNPVETGAELRSPDPRSLRATYDKKTVTLTAWVGARRITASTCTTRRGCRLAAPFRIGDGSSLPRGLVGLVRAIGRSISMPDCCQSRQRKREVGASECH